MTNKTNNKTKENPRDGFEIVSMEPGPENGKVIHFVECDFEGSKRERCERGLLMKTDTERFFVRDTRG